MQCHVSNQSREYYHITFCLSQKVGHGGQAYGEFCSGGLELLHRNIISFISSYGIIDEHQHSSSFSSLVSKVLPLPHLSEDERTAWLFSLRLSLPIIYLPPKSDMSLRLARSTKSFADEAHGDF
jgi:hypothetical protein